MRQQQKINSIPAPLIPAGDSMIRTMDKIFLKSMRLFCLLAFLFISYPSVGANTTTWQSKQKIWWNNNQLIKDAIIAYLKFKTANPDILNKENPSWNILSLVLIFDGHNDSNTLKILAELSPYYLGEAPGEIYQCVVWRKGKKILPYLERALKSEKNECINTFGKEFGACLKADDYRSSLQTTIKAIKENRSCNIDR